MAPSSCAPGKPRHQSVLLVGPDPHLHRLGGVARHLAVLLRLPALKRAGLFDPGSLDGQWGPAAFRVAHRCLKLPRIVSRGDFRQVWLNTSIYPGAFLKLLLMLFSLRNLQGITVRVFFHGGRFQEIPYLRCQPLCDLAGKILGLAQSRHFLSDEQGRGFAAAFPGLAWERYHNFLPQEAPLPRRLGPDQILLFVGRLVREKGIYEILTAFDDLTGAAGRPDLKLWFVGDGPEMPLLRQHVQRRPPGSLKLWGYLEAEALEPVYGQVALLLLPSWREGFPYVILEAMRAGLPIIATPTGALPELIREGENGFLIQPGDTRTLAHRIALLLDDTELAHKIGLNNADKFSREFSRRAADAYYRGLLRGIT
jgi:glycosyltransferase involved in cell wall biosynthesis